LSNFFLLQASIAL